MDRKNNWKKGMIAAIVLLLCFALWTVLIQKVDVQPAGDYEPQKNVGFAGSNVWFHELTGANMTLYKITDWLGLVPIAVCVCFGILGLVQLIQRKSLKKVDRDIMILGVYYIIVIAAYLAFEMIPINYRPVLVDGMTKPESSYPSSTTLLVLSVMPTLVFQANRRMKNTTIRKAVVITAVLFSAFMVIGRLISGVHWLTDIIASVILSAGLYLLYRSAATAAEQKG